MQYMVEGCQLPGTFLTIAEGTFRGGCARAESSFGRSTAGSARMTLIGSYS